MSVDPDRPAGSLDVVIPSYCGAARLSASLPSLLRQLLPGDAVIVVDDASPDGSASLLRDRFPGVRVDAATPNSGFAVTANRGLRSATASTVALLNDDCEVLPGWRAAIGTALRDHPDAGAIACLVMGAADKRVDSAGLVLSGRGVVQRLRGDDLSAAAEPGWVMGPAGAAAVLRADVLTAAGGLDERLESYYEDADLALRLALDGVRCRYEPTARVAHEGGASFGHFTARHVRLSVRNHPLILLRALPTRRLLLLLPSFAVDQLRACLSLTLRRRQGRAWLRGALEFWAMAPAFWQERLRQIRGDGPAMLTFVPDGVGGQPLNAVSRCGRSRQREGRRSGAGRPAGP